MKIYNLITNWTKSEDSYATAQSFQNFETAYEQFLQDVSDDEDYGIMHILDSEESTSWTDFGGYSNIIIGKRASNTDGKLRIEFRLEIIDLK